MTLKSFIRDGLGTGNLAGVTAGGELIVYGIGDTQSKFNSMDTANTAYNFFVPVSNKNFFVTFILVNTPAAATNIDIYEASSTTSTTVDKEILSINTASRLTIPIILPFGGFLKIHQGEFLNAKTDNTTVNMTIMGYYKSID